MLRTCLALLTATLLLGPPALLAQKKPTKGPPFPPSLPGGKPSLTLEGARLLTPTETLQKGVAVARSAPTVDFLFLPGQTYEGKPWSVWGEGLAAGGKFYCSHGDHLAPGGNALVHEYDPRTRSFRPLADLRKLLDLPAGHYTPGKIHGRIDLADDGWLYFPTHRGSTTVTTAKYHYEGDWIVRAHPATGKCEVVARGPAGKHCIPASVVDPRRKIFYGATAPGVKDDPAGIQFFAYDLTSRKPLYLGGDGPARSMILARSTGRVYYTPGNSDAPLMCFDPEKPGVPRKIAGSLGIRAATQETPAGLVYTASQGRAGSPSHLFAFDTKTEKAEDLGPAGIASQEYITSLAADAAGKYVYYVPGAHGGSERDGCPLVQYDTRTRKKKAVAFLHPAVEAAAGVTLRGTFSVAVEPGGERAYVVWNASRGGRAWDCVALTVVHIPVAERP